MSDRLWLWIYALAIYGGCALVFGAAVSWKPKLMGIYAATCAGSTIVVLARAAWMAQ